jgi:uncharacterized membrane protein YhhN
LAIEFTLPHAALAPIALSGVAVAALVVCDYRGFRPGRYLCKPLAALAFLWLALVMGATGSSYGTWILAGLVCCLAGDLLLMADSERSFLAGLVAFLCGHLCYCIAFLGLGESLAGFAVTALPALLLLVFSLRWLMPFVGPGMKVPVIAYTVVITLMLLCAGLTAGQPVAPLVIVGAWCFALSDLAVARRQFVSASPLNGVWGTPLYFGAQMLLAASVGFIH